MIEHEVLTSFCRFDIEAPEERDNEIEEENKEKALKPDDMVFVGPGHDFKPIELGRDEKKPKSSTIVLESTSRGKRFRKVLKCLPLGRRKLENLKNVKMLNSFQE